MTNNDLIKKYLQQGVEEGVYPGAALLVAQGDTVLYRGHVGHAVQTPNVHPVTAETLWDIASLTKPMATVSSLLLLAGEGKLDFKTTSVYSRFSLWDLLHHTSGLSAWQNFTTLWQAEQLSIYSSPWDKGRLGGVTPIDKYQNSADFSLKVTPPTPLLSQEGGLLKHALSKQYCEHPTIPVRDWMRNKILAMGDSQIPLNPPFLKGETKIPPLEKGGRGDLSHPTLYSDLGFILLGLWIEDQTGLPLDRFFEDRIAGPLGLRSTVYRPLEHGIPRDSIAATSYRKTRNQIAWGEVDDDNTALLGGVAGHAGLFSTPDDIHRWLTEIRRALEGRGGLFATELLQPLVTTRPPDGRFHLGFDTPSAIGSQAGTCFSSHTIGHLGFTGCSFWLDLKTGWEVIFLTNRVHPDAGNEKIKRFRPILYNKIFIERKRLNFGPL